MGVQRSNLDCWGALFPLVGIGGVGRPPGPWQEEWSGLTHHLLTRMAFGSKGRFPAGWGRLTLDWLDGIPCPLPPAKEACCVCYPSLTTVLTHRWLSSLPKSSFEARLSAGTLTGTERKSK